MLNSSEAARLDQYKRCLQASRLLYKPINQIAGTDDSVMARVSNYVLAPGLSCFVLWVLKEAVESGKKRLYFLARDGYFMYKAAEVFCKKLALPIECRYLCCSRYSIRIPMFHLDMEEGLDYICRGGIDVTLSKILDRAGLNEKEQRQVVQELNLEISEGESISYNKLPWIREKLSDCECFRAFVETHSKEAMPSLKGYLEQEGLLEEEQIAIVDSGWVGSMQKVLNRLLEYMGRGKRIEGYYWGLYELPPGVIRGEYHCYYFQPENSLKEKVYFSNCLFEVIFSAPHGMTLSYELAEEGYIPKYESIDQKRLNFYQQTEELVVEYVRLLATDLNDLDAVDWDNNRKAVKGLFKVFMGSPTNEEVKLYGNLLFSDDVLETQQQPVAAVLNEQELKANHVFNKILVMLGLRKEYIKESAWYEGSAARESQAVKRHIASYVLYKYLLYIRKTYQWRKQNG